MNTVSHVQSPFMEDMNYSGKLVLLIGLVIPSRIYSGSMKGDSPMSGDIQSCTIPIHGSVINEDMEDMNYYCCGYG